MKQHYKDMFSELFSEIQTEQAEVLPSEYAEKNRTLTSDVSSIQGKFKYSMTPYLREIVDTLSPYHPAKVVAVMKGAQIGFALDISTSIPTPKGWQTMGNIKVGDKVFDEDGNICNVTFATETMYNHDCYNIEFSDGSTMLADANHKWKVWDEKKYEYRKEKILYTKDIYKTHRIRNGTRTRYAISNAKPLNTTEKKLSIHPYLLGLWLGDGNRCSNRITTSKTDAEDLSKIISNFGENNIIDYDCEKGNTCNIVLKRKDGKYNKNTGYVRFGERAEKLNIYRNKHIPKKYLRASKKQRLQLLQGLMDSDGFVSEKGICQFYNVDKKLIDNVYELICSLGLKCMIKKKNNAGKTVKLHANKIYYSKDIYMLTFYGYVDMPIALLKRKKERLNKRENVRHTEIERRRINKVEKVKSVPVKCITVDSESHLYLAGKQMIPTHNTEGVIVNGILWLIANDPGNVLTLSANDDLSKEMVESRLDQGIQSCGITHLIRPNTIRKRNQRTGDTSKYKEYAGGRLFAGGLASVDKLGKQRSIRYGFFDDWDAAEIKDKQQGNIYDLLQQRFSTNAQGMKQYYISTPQTRPSNIEQVYEKGDKRKWHVPCPLCKQYIELKWYDKEKGHGIVFEKDDNGRLIESSVGYKCQKCGGVWKEKHKYKANLKGKWIPTAKPQRPGMYSYHISCLVAAPNMYDWTHYAHQFLDCFKDDRIIQSKFKVFRNLVLGLPWEEKKTDISKHNLRRNTRNYEVGIIPDQLSKQDGNGEIIMLTCSCDLNGTLDDARLDWEVVAHTESGSIYSIDQGSIGTYQSGRKKEVDRNKWTYRNNEENNVWDYFFAQIIDATYYSESGNEMKIVITGVDTGYYAHYAYGFIDSYPGRVIGLKGQDQQKFNKVGVDKPIFKPARERPHLYIIEVDNVKDKLADMIMLKWNEHLDMPQPPGFINFPTPEHKRKKYTESYFRQYEAEEKKIETDDDGEPIGWKWIRRHSSTPNHFFDTAVYNLSLRHIFAHNVMKELGKRQSTWADFVAVVKGIGV